MSLTSSETQKTPLPAAIGLPSLQSAQRYGRFLSVPASAPPEGQGRLNVPPSGQGASYQNMKTTTQPAPNSLCQSVPLRAGRTGSN